MPVLVYALALDGMPWEASLTVAGGMLDADGNKRLFKYLTWPIADFEGCRRDSDQDAGELQGTGEWDGKLNRWRMYGFRLGCYGILRDGKLALGGESDNRH